MSSRKLSDWITAYLKYTDNTEPPKSYHTWVALSLIAGALQRKVYSVYGHETIYPNLYIVLIGPSGRCRKGLSMTIGRDIIKELGVPMTSESLTREALIRMMRESSQSYQEPNGAIKFHCSVTCMSEELSVFLGQNNIAFLSNLTDWYDSRDDWKYETKGAGIDHIQGVCFNLLGATAPDWLQTILPQEAIGGGFTSRVIFIVEENKRKVVAEHKLTEEERKLRTALIEDLRIISNISGPYDREDEQRAAYIKWYEEQEGLMKSGQMPVDDPRLFGYCDRRATHIRKLSMIMAASRRNERLIIKEDFDRSLDVLTAAEVNMSKTFGGIGKSQYSEAVELVLNYLILRGETTKQELLRKFYRDLDPQALKIAEEVLTDMKVLQVIRQTEGDFNVTYKYIGPR